MENFGAPDDSFRPSFAMLEDKKAQKSIHIIGFGGSTIGLLPGCSAGNGK